MYKREEANPATVCYRCRIPLSELSDGDESLSNQLRTRLVSCVRLTLEGSRGPPPLRARTGAPLLVTVLSGRLDVGDTVPFATLARKFHGASGKLETRPVCAGYSHESAGVRHT